MKRTGMRRWLSLLMTSVIAAGSMPVLPAEAAQNTALNIAKVQIEPSEVNEERTVAVDVHIEGNEDGFLAAEFGIAYNDPDIGIDWGIPEDRIITSEKDRMANRLQDIPDER